MTDLHISGSACSFSARSGSTLTAIENLTLSTAFSGLGQYLTSSQGCSVGSATLPAFSQKEGCTTFSLLSSQSMVRFKLLPQPHSPIQGPALNAYVFGTTTGA